MNVLFLTHSFPRNDGDAAGSFVLRLARALVAEDVTVRVVAPGASGLDAHAALSGVQVDRFRYAPRKYETLAYGGNMAAQVRDSFSAKVTLVGFLGAEFRAGLSARREFHPDVIHAHWWFPNGVAATWVARMAGLPLVTQRYAGTARPRGRGIAQIMVRTLRYALRDAHMALLRFAYATDTNFEPVVTLVMRRTDVSPTA